MAEKQQPLRMVGRKPGRPGRPRKLANARDERELLVILRRKVANRLEDDSVPAHAMTHLVKQLRDIDKEVRTIDARVAARVAEEVDFDDDDDEWNPSAI